MTSFHSQLLLIVIVAFSILLMLWRPRNIAEAWWVGAGAAALVLLRLISVQRAGAAVVSGLDVYLFLIGMMLLSELGRAHGVFDWISVQAARRANGDCRRLFLLIYGVGTLTTIFLSNDATAVVLTPAVLAAVRKTKVQPMPYLFACAMVANAASFVLPISNPANLVVFHEGMPPLGQWLGAFTLASIGSIVATFLVLRVYFRKELQGSITEKVDDTALGVAGKIVLGGMVAVVVVLMTASALHKDLGMPTCLAACCIAAVVSMRQRQNPLKLARHLSWSTILLVACLFVLVAAVEPLGLLRWTQAALAWCRSLPPVMASVVLSFSVGVLNNLVNNLPLGLVAGATVQASHLTGLLAHAVLVGVDLGPNLSVTGSLATILWLLALRKAELNVTVWDFLKAGLLIMPVGMLAALGGLLLSHAMFGI